MTGSVLKENELKALNIADDFYRSGTLLVHTAAFVENGNPFLDALQTAKKNRSRSHCTQSGLPEKSTQKISGLTLLKIYQIAMFNHFKRWQLIKIRIHYFLINIALKWILRSVYVEKL